jgi:uncharacterized protein YjbJ (UPF0337 family)
VEHSRTTRIKGRVKEATGWATGDRRVEAEGLVEAETGHEPDQDELRRAEHAVRVAHGDVVDDDKTTR